MTACYACGRPMTDDLAVAGQDGHGNPVCADCADGDELETESSMSTPILASGYQLEVRRGGPWEPVGGPHRTVEGAKHRAAELWPSEHARLRIVAEDGREWTATYGVRNRRWSQTVAAQAVGEVAP